MKENTVSAIVLFSSLFCDNSAFPTSPAVRRVFEFCFTLHLEYSKPNSENMTGHSSPCSKLQNLEGRDFSGGPVAKTPCSQCRGPGFDPWLGN